MPLADSAVSATSEASAAAQPWPLVSLGKLVSVRNGADYKAEEVAEGGFPVIGSGGEFARSSRYLFDGESVLFGRKGTIDKPLHVYGRFWTVDTMFYTVFGSRIFGRFLYYFATTVDYGYYSTNTAVPSMTQRDIATFKVPLPSLKVQGQIAGYLDAHTAKIDLLIERQERLIETLAERRQAVISHAVTKGLDPNISMKNSGVEWLGNVPESWAAAPVKWIASLTTGMTPTSDDAAKYSDEAEGLPWIRPEDLIESGITTTASRFVSALGWNTSRIVPPGATLLCCIGATVGKVGIVDEVCNTNQQITALKSTGHDRFFFYTVLASKSELVSSATGTTLPILNSGRLGSIVLPVPPLAEQATIAAHLDRETAQMDALSAKAREMIEVLKERRQALISAAVTGKIDVRGLS